MTAHDTPSSVHDNPLGLDGFEFVEFTSPDPAAMADLFVKLGFTHIGNHKSKNVRHYGQGDINFILNMEPAGQPAEFRKAHGPSANGMAFRVKDAKKAFEMAIARGATPVKTPRGRGELDIPAIEGIGGSYLYLVDRYGAEQIYDVDFTPVPGATREDNSVGLHTLDHLTHNVNRGRMNHWAGFYERIFNFREIRYFDIEGQQTGLLSRAMTAPDDKIRIPLNESQDDYSQIAEYLKEYKGEGIQHLAFATDDIFVTVDRMKANGVHFQDSPDTYYDMIDQRIPNHAHDVEAMRKRRILIDGSPETGDGLLLQIFTENMIGPIFFEVIQRKGNEGFGEGNFKALFESIELDQIRRGVIPAAAASATEGSAA
ncbi:4-hydroxyphenylpyruvate dioxygenase [Sphingosinicella ginsenosidimutans]|uniref:4-hydroxyphenylpyruvate dioxygenase n=1 Tax=Allosphingosinicella ginsenosidimutans TaxID=1176539 RepID=A0A5C6TYN7_9SPHN|nr:4-hydroxyphenylpyruvate dioxygenase [Sphingosinicella ginsenosidimutans]TXC64808.1 4-hydroxyphenylpyruvate dioxygenase [Sphingosinicella ginsenosidimutans]